MADSLVRLRIDSNEFDSKLKTASQNLQLYFDKVKQGAGTFEYLDDGVLECARALGQLSTKSNTARGSISELTSSFTEWSLRYKQMTEAEKNTPLGRAIKNSLDQLKTRIQDTKNDLASINQELSGSKFGEFGGLIDSVGKKMGINANLTELLTSKTALMTAGIGAGIAIVEQAADAWARYNQELSRQDQVTTVTTGLKGPAANAMTDAARSIADVYNVDFREVINAANTLMTQFGQSGSQAMQLIRDGMQGMIIGDGPKLLSMIQQYAPSFRDAGISASQLVAIIHNSEGGIFTDQNMNAIVMGIKNIRLMTNQTSEALAKMGIDGADMTRKLNDGSMTVFEALGQVSDAIERTGSGSQAAGEVMQYVFGRQGAVAGTKLGEAIATLNTNLNETKRQTGDLGAAFAELQTANERLNKAIREAFEYDGWEQMTVGIKTGLLDALSSVLETTIKIKESWVGDVGKTIFNTIGSAALETMGPLGRLLNLIRGIKSEVSDTGNKPTGVEIGGLMKNLPERVRRPMQEADALRKVEDAPARQEAHRQNLSRYDAQIAEQQQKVSALGDSSLVPEIQEAIEGEKRKLQELQQMRETYAREAEKILAPKVEVKVETQDATARIKELTAKLKELRSEREKARQAGDVEKVKSLDSRISTVSGDIKLLRGSTGTTPSSSTPKPQTELQQNQQAIAKLTEEYQKLATSAKTADEAQQAGISQRMNDIHAEISQLQTRNEELKKFAQEAQSVQYPTGSLPQLTQELNELQQAQADAMTGTVWQQYQQQIEQTSLLIDALKGKWKAGEVATFTIKTNDSELLQKLQDIANVQIADKTLTVTADTAEAFSKVQELVSDIEGREVSIDVKPQAKPLPTLDDYRIQAMLEIDAQNTKVDTNTLQTLLADAMKNGIDVSSLGLESIAEQIGKGIDVPTDKWEEIYDGYKELCEQIGAEPIEINFETGKQKENAKNMKKEWSAAASAIQSVGSAMSQIEDPAAKVVGTVAEAIASVALGYAQATVQAADLGPWAWIAFAAAGAATMVSTIATIKSATKGGFAEGGIVPGNSYSGDLLRTSDYGINSGELILSRSQQDNIASQLTEGDSVGSVASLPYVLGDKIVLGVNNWGRKTGRGELVFSKR